MSFSGSGGNSRMAVHSAPLQMGIDLYVAQTYTLLLLSLGFMTLFGFASYEALPRTFLPFLSAADAVLWIACGWFGWRQPIGFVFPLFGAVTGLLLGQLAHYHATVFAAATTLTLLSFAGLSAFAWIFRRDFSFLAGFLNLAFWVLIAGWIVSLLFPVPLFLLGWTALGVLTFGCWILYDTGQIIKRADADLTPGVAAFELLLDLVGFHSWILEHLRLRDLLDD